MSKNLYLQSMSWRRESKLVQNYAILRIGWIPLEETLDSLHLAINELKVGLRVKLRRI